MPDSELDSFLAAVRQALDSYCNEVSSDLVLAIKSRLQHSGRSLPGESPADPTGALAASIGLTHTGAAEFEVACTASYAAYLEFGTTKMAARPFMAPAIEDVKANLG